VLLRDIHRNPWRGSIALRFPRPPRYGASCLPCNPKAIPGAKTSWR